MPDEEIQDGTADSSTATQDSTDQTDIAGEGDASHEDQTVPFSEHPRWKAVYGDLKEFKTLGELNEVKAKLQRLDHYDQMIQEARAHRADTKEPVTDEERELTTQRAKAREQLYEIAPELRDLLTLGERARAQAEIAQRSTELRAETELKGTLKAAGIPITDASVKKYGNYLVNIIGNDPDLYAEYLGDPKAAVKEAWRRYAEDSAPVSRPKIATTQQRGAALQGLPRGNQGGGGGTPGGGAAAPAQTLDELFKQHRGS
jgi:hypothetical protein